MIDHAPSEFLACKDGVPISGRSMEEIGAKSTNNCDLVIR